MILRNCPGHDYEHMGCLCREKLKEMYTGFCKDYPIVTIEDPFDQDDWDATAAFTAEGVCQV
jgi:enolase